MNCSWAVVSPWMQEKHGDWCLLWARRTKGALQVPGCGGTGGPLKAWPHTSWETQRHQARMLMAENQEAGAGRGEVKAGPSKQKLHAEGW